MSYVVLARRYRPQNLEEIIGQEHISRTLKNAISENRVAHAYLFSGPRGVGKTTTARILAKGLNCKNGPTSEPCGKCVNCQEITQGSSIDVQEIDGASNRGIDEIRALRENIKFAPASSKFKVYIIDEAHQITDAAFNALLKTLEEPPPHVVFILATTESQKIPLTILSRCQRYRFRLLSSQEIIGALKKIIDTEGFRIDSKALEVITASSGGSMRDALSLLDQVISFSSGDVSAKDIEELLGFLPKEIISSTTVALAGADLPKLLEIVREISGQGYNLLQFARDLREHLRHILLYGINPEVVDLPADEKILLESQKTLFSKDWLIRAGRLISKALDEMRWNDQPRLTMELYLLKLAQPYVPLSDLVERLEKIENNIPFDEPETPSISVKKNDKAPVVKEPVEFQRGNAETLSSYAKRPVEHPVDGMKETTASAYSGLQGPAQGKALDTSSWNEIVSEIKSTKPIIGNVLSEVVLVNNSGTIVSLSAGNNFQMESLKRNQAYIEEQLFKKTGRRIAVRVTVAEQKAPAKRGEEEEIVVEEENTEQAPSEMFEVKAELSSSESGIPAGLEKIINKFPGKITKKK